MDGLDPPVEALIETVADAGLVGSLGLFSGGIEIGDDLVEGRGGGVGAQVEVGQQAEVAVGGAMARTGKPAAR